MIKIPFYKNTKDGLRCVQAALKSVLKFNFPRKNFSFVYLDRVTGHEKNKYTWNYEMLRFLEKKGFDVAYIVNFNHKKFIKKGEGYLKKFWTKEVFIDQKSHSSFAKEQRRARLLVREKNATLKSEAATKADLYSYFSKGFLLLIPINAYVLDRKKGYSPHMVLVTNLTKNFISFHDSGLPPHKNRKVRITNFMKAMHYPNSKSGTLIAVRYRNNAR